METNRRDFKGVWIPKEIYLHPDLSWTEKILCVEIDSLDQGEGCWASNGHFARFLGIGESQIVKSITKLRKLGLLIDVKFDGRKRYISLNSDLRSITRQTRRKVLGRLGVFGDEIDEKNSGDGLVKPLNEETGTPSNTSNNTIKGSVNKKQEEILIQLDNNGNPIKIKKPLLEKTPPPVQTNFALSIALLWQKMASNHFSIQKEDIPPISVIKPISACLAKYHFTTDEFKELFKYFLNDEIPEQKKINLYICLSDVYISQYKVYQKITPKTNAWISGEIKL